MEVSLKKIALHGFMVMILGFIFALIETAFFIHSKGYHYLPSSKSELMCDSISLIVCGAGGGLFLYAIITHTVFRIKEISKDLKK